MSISGNMISSRGDAIYRCYGSFQSEDSCSEEIRVPTRRTRADLLVERTVQGVRTKLEEHDKKIKDIFLRLEALERRKKLDPRDAEEIKQDLQDMQADKRVFMAKLASVQSGSKLDLSRFMGD